MEYITMSKKELELVKILDQVISGKTSQIEAATRLKVTNRTIRRRLRRFKENGVIGLIHKNRGKASPHRWNEKEKALTINLLKGEWSGFGPTFTAEKLKELYNITVSRETLRTFMQLQGFWTVRKRRQKYRKRRERKPMRGIMVQLDGSPHDWFEGRAGKCTLLVFIDDATSEILWLEFAPSESTEAIMQATKHYIEQHGRPLSFYVDHGSAFHVNLNNQEKDKKTQWERACGQLDIEVKHAHSPQAKGRVERCNQTLQDRLIKDMRLANISSIDNANKFLREGNFIEKHNASYAKQPAQVGNAHRSHAMHDLADIFSIQETRIMAQDFTVSYQKQIFQLHKEQKTIIRPKDTIIIKTSLNGDISLWIRKTKLFFTEIDCKPIKTTHKEPTLCNKPYKKPSANSYRWRAGLYPLGPNQDSRVKPAGAAVEPLKNDYSVAENRTFSLCSKPDKITLR